MAKKGDKRKIIGLVSEETGERFYYTTKKTMNTPEKLKAKYDYKELSPLSKRAFNRLFYLSQEQVRGPYTDRESTDFGSQLQDDLFIVARGVFNARHSTRSDADTYSLSQTLIQPEA